MSFDGFYTHKITEELTSKLKMDAYTKFINRLNKNYNLLYEQIVPIIGWTLQFIQPTTACT